jgi:ribose-phosphate pyrophosphokinase
MEEKMKLFSGSANPDLAKEIADYINIALSDVELIRFKDNEFAVKICDNVRGVDLFIIQPTSNPANDNIIELLLMIDAAFRASAKRITAVIPYFGYARQDRKVEPRVPISAKVVANLLKAVNINRMLTMELHSDQIQGFFDVPVDNLLAAPIVVQHLKKHDFKDPVVVSPDTGGVVRAGFYGKKLDAGLAIIDKRRPKANISEVMHVIGDVKGKDCIIVDDMVDTGGSISHAAVALKENGARDVYCVATHAVLSDNAHERLKKAGFKEIIFTNTINIPESKRLENMTILSVAPLFGEAIKRIHEGESVSSLFL